MITVLAYTSQSRQSSDHLKALAATCAAIPHPTRAVLLSPVRPPGFHGVWRCPPILAVSRLDMWDFCRLLVGGLLPHLEDSTHCVVVQPDGFAVRPEMWTDDFLEYDYIGAPWPVELCGHPGQPWPDATRQVGNGGFSLRSRRFVEWSTGLVSQYQQGPEDAWLMRALRPDQHGLKVAPLSVAQRWSWENPTPGTRWGQSFGIHAQPNVERWQHELSSTWPK